MSTLKSNFPGNPFAYLNALPMSILVSDLKDGVILFANREFGNVFEHDPEKIRGNQLSSLYHNQDDWNFVLNTVRESERINNYKIPGSNPDGSLRWILLSAETIQAEDGSQLLLSTLIDFTDQKHEEIVLQESEKLYQTVFNSSPVMFWVKDTKNNTLQINQAAAKFEGVNQMEVAGKSC